MIRSILALFLVGCSSSSPPRAASPQDGGGDAANARAYPLSFTTGAGLETHWCQYVRLPIGNGAEVMLTGYRWKWQGMHHWALFRTTSDLPSDVRTDQPFDCFAAGAGKYMQGAAMTLEGDA